MPNKYKTYKRVAKTMLAHILIMAYPQVHQARRALTNSDRPVRPCGQAIRCEPRSLALRHCIYTK